MRSYARFPGVFAIMIIVFSAMGCANLDDDYNAFLEEHKIDGEELYDDSNQETVNKTSSDIMDWLLGAAIVVIDALLIVWILFYGGAEWLEGSLTSAWFIHWMAPRWSASGIRLYVTLSLVLGGAYGVFLVLGHLF